MTPVISNDFAAASRSVLAFLRERLGFKLWMVTRTEDDDWIVLQSEDHGYNVPPGTVFRWTDSFCSQMVKGAGPRVAPHSDAIPAYAAAPIGKQVEIKAYVGVPLTNQDGSLFGTLCAIDPMPQPDAIVAEQPLLELLASLLSTILQMELKAAENARVFERIQEEALTDAMTKLYNRRAWDRLLAGEEERCRRYGYPAAVLVVDLDELKQINDTHGHTAGDELIVRTASALHQAARSIDIVARLGGDEFGILGIECNRDGSSALYERVRTTLAAQGIKASVGLANRDPSRGIAAAFEVADKRMYAMKTRN